MSLVIHAPNIHQGGGRTLLESLLRAARARDCRVIIDERMVAPDFPQAQVALRVKASIRARVGAEFELRSIVRSGDRVLCLGNLPPLVRLRAPVVLYLQNRNLLGERDLSAFPFRDRVRIRLERAWLHRRLANVDEIVVQTPSMARLVEAHFRRNARVLPFVPDEMPSVRPAAAAEYDFIYVASAEPHKNHRTLTEAWRLLAHDGLRPKLCLVLGNNPADALIGWIREVATADKLEITLHREVDRGALMQLYTRSGALIFPSSFESLGLPLLEAAAAGLPILAAEIDVVRDVVTPVQTFEPTSPLSIARAVKRYLGHCELPARPLSAADFLARL